MPRVKKSVSVKKAVKPVKKETSKKTSRLAVARSKNIVRAKSRTTSLSVPVYSLTGRVSGTLSLPKEIFGATVNKQLLAQAVRVYMTNQSTLLGSTKTRGEVEGSTAKIFRQKGTGRARHGGIRAPIFVGGGIAFGPKSRKVRLTLPTKMKKAALRNALSAKLIDKQVMGLSGVEKATGKTKEIAQLLKKINVKNALIVTLEKQDNIIQATRNIPLVDTVPVNLINAYEILKHDVVFVTKEVVERLIKVPTKETK